MRSCRVQAPGRPLGVLPALCTGLLLALLAPPSARGWDPADRGTVVVRHSAPAGAGRALLPGPVAVLVELNQFHDEVLPSSIELLRSLGFPRVVVLKPFNTRGAEYLLGREVLGPAAGSVHLRNLGTLGGLGPQGLGKELKRLEPGLIFVQTFQNYGQGRNYTSQALPSLVGALRALPSLAVLAGCHNTGPTLRALQQAAEDAPAVAHRFVPVAFGPGARAELAEANRSAVLLVPAFLGPVQATPNAMGGEAGRLRGAGAKQDATAEPRKTALRPCPRANAPPVSFVVFSGVDTLWLKSFPLLDLLGSAWPRNAPCLTVRVFGGSGVPESLEAFDAISARVAVMTNYRVRLLRKAGSWAQGIPWGRASDFVLPLVDELSPRRSEYESGRKLTSSVAMAIALGKPLVAWKPLARAFGLENRSVVYDGAQGFPEAVMRAARMRRERPGAYQRLREDLAAWQEGAMAMSVAHACALAPVRKAVEAAVGEHRCAARGLAGLAKTLSEQLDAAKHRH